MRKARWLAEWADKQGKPAIYHCISRVVDRRFVFGDEKREVFRMFMRMYENFQRLPGAFILRDVESFPYPA
ncbi:MAG: hypothetical protein ABJZ54_12605 [Luteolibacter sp.]